MADALASPNAPKLNDLVLLSSLSMCPADSLKPPRDLADAESRRQQVTLDVQSIQAQLGDKQRTDDKGRRLQAREYWAWKKKAQHALNQKLDELRLLKAYIRENRRDRIPSSEQALVLLRDLWDVLGGHVEKIQIPDKDLKKIDAVRAFLCRIDNNKETSNEQTDDRQEASSRDGAAGGE